MCNNLFVIICIDTLLLLIVIIIHIYFNDAFNYLYS